MNISRTIQGIVLTALSAIVSWLAQPNEIFIEGNPFFGLFSYLPIVLFLFLGCNSTKIATRIGAFYGLVTTLTSYYWLANFGAFSLWTIGAVSLGYMGYYSAFFRVLYHVISPQPLFQRSKPNIHSSPFPFNRVLIFAVVWTCFEFLKSRGYLAFPWNLAAFPFHSFVVLNQIVEITGVWIISFTVLMLQASIAEIIHTRNIALFAPGMRYCAVSILMLGLFTVYGSIRISDFNINEDSNEQNTLLVLLIQQNADSWQSADSWQNDFPVLQSIINISRSGLSESQEVYNRMPDIISWSENSLRYPYEQYRALYEQAPSSLSFNDFLRESGTELLSGVPLDRGNSIFMNGVIHLNAQGDILGDYGKIHLIPFAEHVPLSDLSYMKNFMENVVGLPGDGWTAGNEIRTMFSEHKGIRIGTPVCFEDSFGNNTRAFVQEGADVLINLTNNAWSRTESAQVQHFIAARYRSIENRRPLLRATNAGLTSIVLPSGRIHTSIPMFEEGYLLSEIPIETGQGKTIYTQFGDWFAYALMVCLIGILILRHYRA